MCALRLGFLDAFPHYPLQNGTCCRTPHRVATLLAARGKQCWDADGFSEQRLFRTYFTALIARKSPSCFYLRMRRAFQNCATFSGATAMTSALQNSFFTSEKIIIIPTLPRSVYGVAAFSIFFFFLSCSAINSWECCCLSYFMCHWLQQSLLENFHCVRIYSLFLPASALHFLTLPDFTCPYMLAMNPIGGLTWSFFFKTAGTYVIGLCRSILKYWCLGYWTCLF